MNKKLKLNDSRSRLLIDNSFFFSFSLKINLYCAIFWIRPNSQERRLIVNKSKVDILGHCLWRKASVFIFSALPRNNRHWEMLSHLFVYKADNRSSSFYWHQPLSRIQPALEFALQISKLTASFAKGPDHNIMCVCKNRQQ